MGKATDQVHTTVYYRWGVDRGTADKAASHFLRRHDHHDTLIISVLITAGVTFGLHFTTQIHRTALFIFLFSSPFTKAHVRYDLEADSCTIQSR